MDYVDIEKRIIKICKKALFFEGSNSRIKEYLNSLPDEYTEYTQDFILQLMEYKDNSNHKLNKSYEKLIAESEANNKNEYWYRKAIYAAFRTYLNNAKRKQERKFKLKIELEESSIDDIYSILLRLLNNLKNEERAIVLWRLGLCSENEACELLHIKRSRLFKKWSDLQSSLHLECKGILEF